MNACICCHNAVLNQKVLLNNRLAKCKKNINFLSCKGKHVSMMKDKEMGALGFEDISMTELETNRFTQSLNSINKTRDTDLNTSVIYDMNEHKIILSLLNKTDSANILKKSLKNSSNQSKKSGMKIKNKSKKSTLLKTNKNAQQIKKKRLASKKARRLLNEIRPLTQKLCPF